jgi:hypothetical protein
VQADQLGSELRSVAGVAVLASASRDVLLLQQELAPVERAQQHPPLLRLSALQRQPHFEPIPTPTRFAAVVSAIRCTLLTTCPSAVDAGGRTSIGTPNVPPR